jgi:hypothetical protein
MELRAGNNGVLAGFIVVVSVNPADPIYSKTVSTVSGIACPGAQVGDWIRASPTVAVSGALGVTHAFCETADEVSLAIVNPSLSNIGPATINYNFLVLKPVNLARELT